MHGQICNENAYDLAIVGAGVAGAALLVQLMSLQVQNNKVLRVIVFDPYKIGEGIAFNQKENFILCNTSVDANSLYPHDREHFLNWLKARDVLCHHWEIDVDNLKPSSFVPRGLLKEYVVEHANEALEISHQNGFDISHKQEMVSSVDETAHGFLITSEKACQIFAQNLVVSTGLSIPNVPFQNVTDLGGQYIASPYYISSQIEKLQNCSSVAILGTRQSAVDAALLVHHIAPLCKIIMMSPSAQFPNVRTYMVEEKTRFFTYENLLKNLLLAPDEFAEYWNNLIVKELHTAISSKGRVRHHDYEVTAKDDFSNLPALQKLYQNVIIAESYSCIGAPWERIDRGIITVTNDIWPILSDEQRKSVIKIMKPFMRDMFSAIPTVNARKLINLAKAGKLEVVKGPRNVRANRDGLLVVKDDLHDEHKVQFIINATGFTTSPKWDHLRTPPHVLYNTNKTGPKGLFFLGPLSGDLQAISNYMNATVRQATSVAKKLHDRFTNNKRRQLHA